MPKYKITHILFMWKLNIHAYEWMMMRGNSLAKTYNKTHNLSFFIDKNTRIICCPTIRTHKHKLIDANNDESIINIAISLKPFPFEVQRVV